MKRNLELRGHLRELGGRSTRSDLGATSHGDVITQEEMRRLDIDLKRLVQNLKLRVRGVRVRVDGVTIVDIHDQI